MGKGGGAREASGTHRAARGGGNHRKGIVLKKTPWKVPSGTELPKGNLEVGNGTEFPKGHF